MGFKERFFVEIQEVTKYIDEARRRLKRHIVGQDDVVEKLLLALVAGGHVLIEGVPGIAKTLIASSLAQLLGLSFKRIQFTPDLLPSDLIGMSIFRPDVGKFVVEKGPVFTNVVLADEINRSPPKVHSALLEVMAEKQVTIFGETFFVYPPYFVMATQNPIEQEGTYPLPEAELDRFMMKIMMGYPSGDQETQIIKDCMVDKMPKPLETFLKPEEILAMQEKVDEVHIDERVIRYAVAITNGTRPTSSEGEKWKDLIVWGASPRASMWLVRGAKTAALFEGRDFVTPHDIKMLAPDVLRHRIVLTYKALSEGLSSDTIISFILKETASP